MQLAKMMTIRKTFLAVTASVFIAFAIIGPSICVISQQAGCQVMGDATASMCQMNIGQHIDHWNQIFVSVLPTLAVLATVFIALGFISDYLAEFSFGQNYIASYLRGHPDIGRNRRIFSALRRGIIQPIIYA